MSELVAKISDLIGQSDSPIGKVDTVVPGVWRCDVFHDDLPQGKLHVGMIGRQAGANFCANHSFDQFTPEQKASIIEQIKAQHGNASTADPVELPEDISLQEFDDEADDEDEDDDDLEDTAIE